MNIRSCPAADLPQMFSIINDAAQAYKGIIPADRWHEPYMPLEELKQEIRHGVAFSGCESDGKLVGMMGIQDRGEVALIRHAYVQTSQRRKGRSEEHTSELQSLTNL